MCVCEREGINDWDSLEIFLADHCQPERRRGEMKGGLERRERERAFYVFSV